MNIQTIIVGPIGTNCYLVSEKNYCFLVDPGDEPQKIINFIGNLNLKFILLTHGHFDHVLALREIVNTYPKIKIYLNKNDQDLANDASAQAELFGIESSKINLNFNGINDGDEIKFGNKVIKVIFTPGHTPGSVCYLLNNTLFSGDTLFYRSIGRTDFAGGDDKEMQKSLAKLAKLPEKIKVLPGHGPETTIKAEKQHGYLKQTLTDYGTI